MTSLECKCSINLPSLDTLYEDVKKHKPSVMYFTKNVYVIKTKEAPNLLACYTMLIGCNTPEGLSLQQHCCENLKSYETESPSEAERLALEICDYILLTLLF
jgi:hypothetical protein